MAYCHHTSKYQDGRMMIVVKKEVLQGLGHNPDIQAKK